MATAQAKQGNDWFQSQQQYWEQWFKAQDGQWADLMKAWQGGTIPGADAYHKTFAQAGQQFLDMLQQFHRSTGLNKPAGEAAQDWLSGLQQAFAQLFQSSTQGAETAEAYKNFAHLGESMLKAGGAWASAFQQPGAQGFGSAANFDPFGFYASIPGIGYTREKQEAWSELYKRWAHFERLLKKYNAAMAKVGLEAVQKFQGYLFNPPADAAPLKSLKEIYVKWVDVCEDIYARFAVTPEYTELYGEVVNALMSFKQQQNKLTDDMVSELNLPTRKEVDSLHERLHAIRRENLALKKEIAEIRKAVFKDSPQPAPKAKTAKPAKKAKK
jgi:class III poly(R)-hydroxyalkanoic acid synthase PhaE subunit